MATTYLTRTNSGAGSETTSTFSAWFKRSAGTGTQYLLHTSESAGNDFKIIFNSTSKLRVIGVNNNSDVMDLTSNRLFLDVGAWYHLVVVFDTTQATAADRVKIYINGVQETSFSTATYPSQNLNLKLNQSGDRRTVGNAYDNGGSASNGYWDGSMTHVHFIDGTAYTASTFGETDSTSGIWKPKTSPSVTYGNNGFFLKMENASAMGTDSSGESNTFTVSGSLTKNQDTPDNNFATMNPLDNYYTVHTFANGNTTVIAPSSGYSGVIGAMGASTGKYYFEFKPVSKTGDADEYSVGIVAETVKFVNQPQWKMATGYMYTGVNGNKINNDTSTSYGNTFTAGDIVGVAMDLDNNKLYFSKNGVWQTSGDPTSGATGTGAAFTLTAPSSTEIGFYLPCCAFVSNSAGATMAFNFGNGYFQTTAVSSAGTNASGNGIFEYDVPTGYTAISTKGLNS